MGWGLDDIFSSAGDLVGGIGKGLSNTISSIGSGIDDLAHLGLDITGNLATMDFDGLNQNFSAFEDIGSNTFGTGGWYKLPLYFTPVGKPGADLAANLIENKGSAGDSFRNAAKQYAVQQGVDYLTTPTSSLDSSGVKLGETPPPVDSPYSLGNSNVSLGSSGSSVKLGGMSPADTSISGQWASFAKDNPYTAAALKGAGQGGINALVSGKNFGEGLASGAAYGAIGQGASDLSKGNSMYSLSDGFYSSPSGEGLSFGDKTTGPALGMNAGSLGDDNWFNTIKNNPWMQTTLGFLGGTNPQFAQLSKAIYGDKATQNPWLSIGAGLGGMYLNNQSAQRLKGQLGAMDQNRGAYTTQLEKSLARKDAAMGRRSQYGPRAVELQAKLAALDAQRMPTIMKGEENLSKLRGQQMAQGLNTLYQNRDTVSKGYDNLMNWYNSFGG